MKEKNEARRKTIKNMGNQYKKEVKVANLSQAETLSNQRQTALEKLDCVCNGNMNRLAYLIMMITEK